jgi:hypothetical protein
MINFQPEMNFWELNPELKYPEVLNDFYLKDKSKDKSESSKVMNAIYLLLDKESRYRELPEKERRGLIVKDYLKNITFNWDSVKHLQDFYIKLTTSKAKKLLRNWELKLEERDEYIGNLKYDDDTAEHLDKMMSKTQSIWEQYLSILNEVEKEEGAGNVKGGGVESLSETGRI